MIKMNNKNVPTAECKKIDWMITLVPLGIVIALCVLFFAMPAFSFILSTGLVRMLFCLTKE